MISEYLGWSDLAQTSEDAPEVEVFEPKGYLRAEFQD